MWFWATHGWMITSLIYLGYTALALLFAWLVVRAFRSSRVAAVYAALAGIIAIPLINFISGISP